MSVFPIYRFDDGMAVVDYMAFTCAEAERFAIHAPCPSRNGYYIGKQRKVR